MSCNFLHPVEEVAADTLFRGTSCWAALAAGSAGSSSEPGLKGTALVACAMLVYIRERTAAFRIEIYTFPLGSLLIVPVVLHTSEVLLV